MSRRAIPCFFFLCCSLAAFSFLRISLSSLPTASCSAPSAPPCAARVLAQLRAPLLRPDAASRPVSLLERSNLVALDEHRAAMGFSVLSLFCFCLQEANVLPPILLQDLGSRLPLGQRGSKGKANKGGEREKSFSFISATALFFLSLTRTPSLYLDLDLTAPGGKNSNKRSLRRPRRGEGSLPLARAHGPCQVEGGAHRVCGSGRVGHRDLLGDEDLWGRGEEGRRGPRRCRCGAGKVKKRPQPFATGGETHPAVLFSLSFSVLI